MALSGTLKQRIDRLAGPSAAFANRVEAGEPAEAVARELKLVDAVDVVASVALSSLGDDGSLGLGLIRAKPKFPQLARWAADESTFEGLFPGTDRPRRLALAAGLLQILDAWGPSHEAAQMADDLGESRTAAAWHMVAHRREPDPFNARYWARRVPRSGLFEGLAEEASSLAPGVGFRVDRDGWDPTALIDYASKARPGSAEEAAARRLQRAEMWALLEASLDGLA